MIILLWVFGIILIIEPKFAR